MNKEETIAFINKQIEEGKITKEDLLAMSTGPHSSSQNLINTFYGIGAIIVLVGVSILTAQHWSEIGFAGRCIVTLGIAFASFVGALFGKGKREHFVSQTLYVLAAILAPIGFNVLFNNAGVDFNWLMQAITAAMLLITFSAAASVHKKPILTLIRLAYSTWIYLAIASRIVEHDYTGAHLAQWAIIVLALSYACFAFWFDTMQDKERHVIRGIIYGLSTLAFLGAGISIGGSFNFVYILFIFAAFYGSVFVKSRSMLIFAALFLVAHILNLTSTYFVDSIGWPVSLIFIGFLIIGIGYGTLYLNKQFISVK